MIRKARKKPVEIEYITYEDLRYMWDNETIPEILMEKGVSKFSVKVETSEFVIHTLEGDMTFTEDDVLIIGVKGEIYPCKIDIFELTYDLIK